TIKVRTTTRSGRVAESSAAYTVSADAGPTVQFDSITPAGEIYAGGSVTVAASAADDLAVSSIGLSLSPNVGSVSPQAAVKPTPTTMTRSFTATLNKDVPSGTSVALVLSASDAFPGRAATTVQQ